MNVALLRYRATFSGSIFDVDVSHATLQCSCATFFSISFAHPAHLRQFCRATKEFRIFARSVQPRCQTLNSSVVPQEMKRRDEWQGSHLQEVTSISKTLEISLSVGCFASPIVVWPCTPADTREAAAIVLLYPRTALNTVPTSPLPTFLDIQSRSTSLSAYRFVGSSPREISSPETEIGNCRLASVADHIARAPLARCSSFCNMQGLKSLAVSSMLW